MYTLHTPLLITKQVFILDYFFCITGVLPLWFAQGISQDIYLQEKGIERNSGRVIKPDVSFLETRAQA